MLLEKAEGGMRLKGSNFRLRGKRDAILNLMRIMVETRKIRTELSSPGYWWITQNIKERRN